MNLFMAAVLLFGLGFALTGIAIIADIKRNKN
jgi:hypothetical protein